MREDEMRKALETIKHLHEAEGEGAWARTIIALIGIAASLLMAAVLIYAKLKGLI
jgi:hypothetical protein